MFHALVKHILFSFEPETAHYISLQGLQWAHQLHLTKFFPKPKNNPCSLMGLHFPNRIGLAAGFDKNAEYIDALAEYGFGFIEIGTVTPQPQLGNPSPRIFRLPEHQAIINQLGFNNKGAEYVAHQLSQTKYKGILGINIGKNLA